MSNSRAQAWPVRTSVLLSLFWASTMASRVPVTQLRIPMFSSFTSAANTWPGMLWNPVTKTRAVTGSTGTDSDVVAFTPESDPPVEAPSRVLVSDDPWAVMGNNARKYRLAVMDPTEVKQPWGNSNSNSNSNSKNDDNINNINNNNKEESDSKVPFSEDADLKPKLRACEPDYERAAEDCRVQLGASCSRSKDQYATCVENQCVCLATPCRNKATCQDKGLCGDDEEARCRTRPSRFPRFPGVCECAAKGEGCKSDSACRSAVQCNELHRDLYPQFARCVNGRCVCRRVDCARSDDEERDREACKEAISCPTDSRPYCNAKLGVVSAVWDGYCSCRREDDKTV
ncbi:hypothetical protein CDD80_3670 [Ophiocordyceps camponoti-rufipedis]|uniref:Uncharacterized protein n=1 Tax=Ophiocordyceps camponoti-rufipedis TaxID=2004952 RepID=A0A2C5Z0V4_9HYPO|nr:hypothetical protein CDD80_3670 [Ophiocordyceps camponoti-rufipedis]